MTKQKIFISTVPKAGKNVLLNFLHHIGFSPLTLPDPEAKELLLQYTQSGFFSPAASLATWAAPCPNATAQTKIPQILENFLPLLKQMTEKTFIHHHFPYDKLLYQTLRQENIPMVFLYRDPRDILLSMANYYLSQGKPPHLKNELKDKSKEEILHQFLQGTDTLVPFSDYLASFTGWIGAEGVLCIRFEDIIGPLGGGNTQAQNRCFDAITQGIHWHGNPEEKQAAIINSFSSQTGTFFKGQIGAWAKSFSQEILELFNTRCTPLLTAWHYPPIHDLKKISNPEGDQLELQRENFVELLRQKEEFLKKSYLQLIDKRDQKIAQNATTKEKYKNLINEKLEIILELKKQQAQSYDQLTELKKKYSDNLHLLDQLTQEIKNKTLQIKKQNEEAKNQEIRIKSLKENLTLAEHEIRKRDKKIKELRQKVMHLESDIKDMPHTIEAPEEDPWLPSPPCSSTPHPA